MSETSVNILLKVNSEELHRDQRNPLNHIEFIDNQPSDTYDDPRDKSTFDSIADPGQMVTWVAEDISGMGHLAIITNIEFKDAPEGFFEREPYDVGDGEWIAVLGENATNHNIAAKYTITFDSGYRNDPPYVIDPKLQIKNPRN
jgi:hypothetical protein